MTPPLHRLGCQRFPRRELRLAIQPLSPRPSTRRTPGLEKYSRLPAPSLTETADTTILSRSPLTRPGSLRRGRLRSRLPPIRRFMMEPFRLAQYRPSPQAHCRERI